MATPSSTPPKAVIAACKKALALKDEYAGKGLRPHTVQWAQHLAAGKQASPEQARRMRAYFRRHKVDKRAGWDKPPTPGYVAWLMWGGDAGFRWAEQRVAHDEQDGEKSQGRAKDAIRPPGAKKKKKATAKAAAPARAPGRKKKKAASKRTVRR